MEPQTSAGIDNSEFIAAMKKRSAPVSEEAIEAIAKICHEANRAYCATLGDTSQVAWEAAPEWQRESARDGVRKNLQRGMSRASPTKSHDDWMEQRLRDGWKYGPVKDAEKKEHPCLLPYDALPPQERRKDAIFTMLVGVLDPRSEF